MAAVRRLAQSLPAAAVLSLVVAAQSLGASWSPPLVIARYGTIAGLAAVGQRTVVAAFEECAGDGCWASRIVIRRSTDRGVTWGERHVIKGAYRGALYGFGTTVDLLWRDDMDTEYRYAHSHDSGRTFGRSSRPIEGPSSHDAATVTRGPRGLVALAWGEWPEGTNQIAVKVSRDGGHSFGATHSWPTTNLYWSSVAIGDGVVYVAYDSLDGTPVLRRSVDGGRSWSRALAIPDTPLGGGPVVAAEGNLAWVAYSAIDENEHRSVRYRRTADRGATWSAARAMTGDGVSAYAPAASLKGGIQRSLFCTDYGVYYSQSSDGLTWSSPEKVTPGLCGAYLAVSGRRAIVFMGEFKLTVRTRSP